MPNDELKHYGVIGMKWGVRRSAAQLKKGARGRRDIALSKSTTKEQRKAAKAKYKQEVTKIKMDAKTKLADIDKAHPGYVKAKKAVGIGLGVIGGTAVTAVGVSALAVGVEKAMYVGLACAAHYVLSGGETFK